jgi:hypothetical protein
MNPRRFRIAILAYAGMMALACAGFATPPAQAQTNQVSAYDPLKVFVGTWTAKKPNESIPYLFLKLKENDGQLTGIISHFNIGSRSPGQPGESPITDLRVTSGELTFTWRGDPPLHEVHARFVLAGTQVAHLILVLSKGDLPIIRAESPGVSGMNPAFSMRREVEGAGLAPAGGEKAARPWEAPFLARLINTAELQYQISNRVYADYPTLVRSGQLQETGRRDFTILPGSVQSETDPLPGSLVSLRVSADKGSYQLLIREKTSTACERSLFSDESGIISEGRALGCPAN